MAKLIAEAIIFHLGRSRRLCVIASRRRISDILFRHARPLYRRKERFPGKSGLIGSFLGWAADEDDDREPVPSIDYCPAR